MKTLGIMHWTLDILFPFRLHLTILQQEHYEVGRFLKWVFTHFFTRRLPTRKPVVWTVKAKALFFLSLIVSVVISILVASLGIWSAAAEEFGIWVFYLLLVTCYFLLLLSPWLPLAITQLLLLPLETWKKRGIIAAAATRLSSFSNLTVVGIAGSYGKTSMKTIVAHILKGAKKVLATPLSHNVPMGVAEVIDLELDEKVEVFVVEMGEFYRGDVRELCRMVKPNIGMITGLNSQHTERLGTIEKAAATLFELADWFRQHPEKNILGKIFLNSEDENIRHHVASHGLENEVVFYSPNQGDFQATNVRFTEEGTMFDLQTPSLPLATCRLPLLGTGQITNVLGALTVATRMGVPLEHLLKRLESLPQIPHRLERKVWENGMLLIDDAFNSNVDGFRQALDVLGKLPRTNKILVTPGIIELGNQTKNVHEELGKIANQICTRIVLVGRSERTEALASALDPAKTIWINGIHDLWPMIPTLCPDPKDSIILLENDLPESGM